MRCERLRQAFGAAPSEENGSEAEPSFAPGTLHQSFSETSLLSLLTWNSFPDYLVFSSAPSGITP